MPTSKNSDPASKPPPPSSPESTQPTTSTSPPSQRPPPPPILLALSGPTSSGKTSLATALGEILPPPPHTLTLHADDFYRPDSQIPITDGGLQDWDCAGSLDLERFERVLRGIKDGTGGGAESLPRQGNFEQEEDDDGVHGVRGIGRGVISRLREAVAAWPDEVKGRRLVIVDGFLLFGRSVPAPLRDLFDVKVLLRARYADAKRRRERRNGYVTLEGFWQDPPGYFDGVVWPNYLAEHGGMVGAVGAEGALLDDDDDGDGDDGEGGSAGRGVSLSDPGWGLEECLEWVVGVVRGRVEGINGGVGV